ncbi:MAG: ribbon-helix-helix protein, CopG family [Deltaproteobacteria bacterium]|nr:ribbon-helix-helix protein, CopG family [Deltaproteobacteria bacterium]
MFEIQLEKELERQLDLLAESKGRSRSAIVREAIVRYLEDNEDVELAQHALTEMSGSKSLNDLRKDLGLDN